MQTIKAKFSVIGADVTKRCILVCSFSAVAGVGFGYDFTWWGSILGSVHFNQVYGEQEVPLPTGRTIRILSTNQTSVGTGLGAVGLVLGCLVASYFNETFGRKRTILGVVAGVGLVGTLIQALSVIPHSYWMCVIGKMIINASLGTAITVVPLYMSECAPPAARGGFVALYSMFQAFGVLLGSIVIYIIIDEMSMINYLLPIMLQAILPFFLLATVPFICPESPRWLATKGRLDEATAVLDSLRPKTADSHEQHMKESIEIKASFDAQSSSGGEGSWIDLFRKGNLKRTLTVIGYQCLQQAQGASFMTYYLVVTFLGMGISNVYLVLIGFGIWGMGIAFVCLFLPDLIGRRALLLGGSCLMFGGLIVVAAVGGTVVQPTGALANLVIASIFFWSLGFSGGWGSVVWLLSAEIPARPVAEKTMALGGASQFASSVLITFVAPYIQNPGYGNLGPKICYIFSAFCLVAFVFVYLLVPETAGRSIFEIEQMYEAGLPARKFKSYDTSNLVADKQRELGLEEEKLSVPDKMELDDKDREISHFEDSRGQAFA